MEQSWGDLRTGEENKSAFVQPGMGERQGVRMKDQVAVKKEVEIKGTLCPALVAYAPMFTLNPL